MIHHLHRLRNKPEHVKKNVAMLSAGALTAVVAIGWLGVTIAGGTLALAPTSIDSTGVASASAAVTQTGSGISQLLGAVGAVTGATPAQVPALTIVDAGTSSTLNTKPAVATTSVGQQTVIPF